MNFARYAAAIAVALLISNTAEARHRHHYRHHYKAHHHHIFVPPHARAAGCIFDNNGRQICQGPVITSVWPRQAARELVYDANGNAAEYNYRGMRISNRIPIPTPAGTWRISKSCGERLAAYWGLGKGLDGSWEWARRFERAYAPGPRVAVVMPGHVMGIIGGGPGAWRVVSFNGDGRHGNVEFTVNRLNGILVDTTRPRVARR